MSQPATLRSRLDRLQRVPCLWAQAGLSYAEWGLS